jgi:hypothetical protein
VVPKFREQIARGGPVTVVDLAQAAAAGRKRKTSGSMRKLSVVPVA